MLTTMETKRCHHTQHVWRNIGPGGTYDGMACVLWCCDRCGKERELFDFVVPKGKIAAA